jgi:hypothetical protein
LMSAKYMFFDTFKSIIISHCRLQPQET